MSAYAFLEVTSGPNGSTTALQIATTPGTLQGFMVSNVVAPGNPGGNASLALYDSASGSTSTPILNSGSTPSATVGLPNVLFVEGLYAVLTSGPGGGPPFQASVFFSADA